MNVLITGASRGIGREIAMSFCGKPGNTVVALSRSEELLEDLFLQCNRLGTGSALIPLPFDLLTGDLDLLTRKINEIAGRLDVLVNNAGLLIKKEFSRLDKNDFDRIFAVNVRSPFLLVQSLLPIMHRESHIINIGSMGGFQGSAKFPGLSLYSASKGALAILTECLAEELKEAGIRVNCLAIGSVQTEMLSEAFPGYTAPVSPEQMGDFIREFAINGRKFFNGKVLPVSLSTP
ncbi:MAG: SDR family oxidoreductase [Bacteroidales bacterium]|nr:SDR family oxidoreductase [Bacteroidales bacterium]